MKRIRYTQDGMKSVEGMPLQRSEWVREKNGVFAIFDDVTQRKFIYDPEEDRWRDEQGNEGRICSYCGRIHTEGYWLDDEYACSDACGVNLYDGDEDQMREDIEEGLENDEDFGWVNWN